MTLSVRVAKTGFRSGVPTKVKFAEENIRDALTADLTYRWRTQHGNVIDNGYLK